METVSIRTHHKATIKSAEVDEAPVNFDEKDFSSFEELQEELDHLADFPHRLMLAKAVYTNLDANFELLDPVIYRDYVNPPYIFVSTGVKANAGNLELVKKQVYKSCLSSGFVHTETNKPDANMRMFTKSTDGYEAVVEVANQLADDGDLDIIITIN